MIFKECDKVDIDGEEYGCLIANEQWAILAKCENGEPNVRKLIAYCNEGEFTGTVICGPDDLRCKR